MTHSIHVKLKTTTHATIFHFLFDINMLTVLKREHHNNHHEQLHQYEIKESILFGVSLLVGSSAWIILCFVGFSLIALWLDLYHIFKLHKHGVSIFRVVQKCRFIPRRTKLSHLPTMVFSYVYVYFYVYT